jgi:membrane protein implicated in regulation of membrane protease activity
MELLYWHWIVFGIGLVLFELIIPSFTALWFGLGAIFVGLLLVISPELSLTLQITCWALVSAALTFVWFKVLRPSHKIDKDASLHDVDGEIGLVISKPSTNKPGKVRFSTPLKGYDEWEFKTEESVHIGDQVQVINISENILVMKKY